MSLTDLFNKLDAPLANRRWSWGGTRKDGTVFLRVWQDRKKKIDGKWHMMVTHHAAYKDDPESLGYQERLRHVKAVKAGVPCYMVMCLAKCPEDRPRQIKSYDKKDVFLGGDCREFEGDTWLELRERVSIKSIAT